MIFFCWEGVGGGGRYGTSGESWRGPKESINKLGRARDISRRLFGPVSNATIASLSRWILVSDSNWGSKCSSLGHLNRWNKYQWLHPSFFLFFLFCLGFFFLVLLSSSFSFSCSFFFFFSKGYLRSIAWTNLCCELSSSVSRELDLTWRDWRLGQLAIANATTLSDWICTEVNLLQVLNATPCTLGHAAITTCSDSSVMSLSDSDNCCRASL